MPALPRHPRPATALAAASLAAALAGCGGGEVSGVLSGLGSDRSVTLANNGSDALTLTDNGRFTFAQALAARATYEVTVLTQPAAQVCTVSRGSGTIDTLGNSVDDVRVDCTFTPSLRGVVTGLGAGMALTLANGSATQVVAANGAFAFAGTVADGTAYDVRVRTQPAGVFCTISNGAGTFFAARFDEIVVRCG